MTHLRRCLELAAEALKDGDGPFGSVLADRDGNALQEDRNRETSTGDPTAHPEFALARWAGVHLDPETRAGATIYTSGEHCPMCSAAQGWSGVGRVVYIASSAQLTEWRAGWGADESPVRALPIQEVAPAIEVVGPVSELVDEIRTLHRTAAGA
ncbi:nucleoside deaminase [Nocardioides sp. KC13]|uniref:Nucleoside deaminase n=2 Tax=Nocardioides turkmenicus TaxID=2711220 RepID=A0A6M1R5K1_9ACTN|nr:nucleoside deaminase [Nocardioides sp. KC13]NGN91737.1 nucleoside deaminase [Nocardioides sp. KC13]